MGGGTPHRRILLFCKYVYVVKLSIKLSMSFSPHPPFQKKQQGFEEFMEQIFELQKCGYTENQIMG